MKIKLKENFKRNNKNKGVTLIALVVTIVVLLILAGVTIATLTGENGILTNAEISKIQTELANYKEEVELFKLSKKIENSEFNEESLSAGKNTINYNTKQAEEKGNIKTIITDIDDKYLDNITIIKGKLLIKTTTKNELKAAQAVGIEINPYKITENGELESADDNLVLVDNEGTLTLPDYVTKIGNGVFSGVKGVKKIIIPPSVKQIGDYAFNNNQDLEEVIIQGDIVSIGGYAFDGTKNLKSINLPDSIETIGWRAFRGSGLTQVIIPKNVKTLNLDVFDRCPLTNVILQEGIENLGTGIFQGCLFEKISLPSTLKSIDSSTFSGCNKLSEFDLSKNANFILESGMLLNKDKSQVIFIVENFIKDIDTFKIPEGITNFNTNISKYTNIKKIIIPKSLITLKPYNLPTSINAVEINEQNENFIVENEIIYNNQNALIMCYSKDINITIQEGIVSINEYAFKQATNVQILNLPNTLNNIGGRALEYLYNIKNINIKEEVNYIAPLFRTNLSGTINIDTNNEKYVVENNILYEKKDGKKYKIVKILYKINGTLEIEKDITTLGRYSFYAQSNLEEIVIPNGVTIIESNAFNYCSKLKIVEIPKSVTYIGNNCFSDATNNLEQIIIHNTENAISGSPWGAVKGARAIIWKPEE